MRVLLASPRGFCAGVVRAIAIVEKALEQHGAPVYVRHEIVHNAHVVNRLRGLGAVFVEELDEVPEGAVTVFSAHGVPRSVVEAAHSRALPVLDATCPLVTKVHLHGARFAREGRHVVLIGHAGHPEVVGTLGQIDAPVHLVARPEDVDSLPLPLDAPLAYITQTTLSVDDTRLVIAALKARFSNVAGPDVADICYATQNRQNAVRDLAEQCDALIVVGAANSSNSNRLRDVAASMGKPAWLVNDGSEVDPAWLEGIATIGITAGASAPESLVEDVIARLSSLRQIQIEELDGIVENVSFSLPAALRRPAPAAAS
ncbi:4-hydroxy-3-methylbut-2-enyl diphosphate reductase [Novosphingobium umbonatum]|uniref:4-hydroxy-3-methylbut-2-enyl diphosphate reductase n=1 Tax=Novosphingobium umbonatum TaxID=1908524 RepID=A0A437N6G7_9SPHN|nr:4-hydroxy-3-methylbut-2-enyl diphosphate reductase [Novosphingobium umbonatum]RVU05502.1 4-hydroxy-3-methylbut-2-enyl diphosphate reductase [Novosphingobium umbonatum]